MVKMSKYSDIETMTVGELINELSKFPRNMAVITEGCDCMGSATTLQQCNAYEAAGTPEHVLIRRGVEG